MNYKRIIAGLFIIGSIIILSAFIKSDDDPIARIIAQLNKWMNTHPQEKAYLQLEKTVYAAGDNIWFKAYVTAGGKHRLSAISGVLNVELIDDRDSVKQCLKLPLQSGLTWGDFALPDTLKEGNYRVRAYTNWMRNAGDVYFFDENITVTNAATNAVFTNTIYSYSSQNGQQLVSAAIKYTNLDGAPYQNIMANYLVQFGNKTIIKGRGQTDTQGILNVVFVNPEPMVYKLGRIITELKLSDKKLIQKSVLIKATSANVDVQFFPEGGNLVNGNNTKMAFKAVGADGLGANVKGIVIDNQNKQVTSFGSTHLGMGVFNYQPQNGKSYKAKITDADGSANTIDLPPATNAGYALSVDDSGDNISVAIKPGTVVEKGTSQTEVLSLIVQSGGVVYYAGKSSPGSKSFTAVVPKNKFPTGIVQFTLFNSAGEPLNERLVFVQNNDALKLKVKAGEQTYSTRGKVKLELNARDKNDQPVIGSFSVSVTDETKVPEDVGAENTILSNLLLTSEVKGYIEQPGYYFNNVNEKTKADLDVLLLTQGYHRFEWKEVMSGSYPPVEFAPEKSLAISGHLKTLLGKPVANGKVTLFTAKKGLFMIDTVTDANGHFTFNNLVFGDSVKFMVQGRTAKDRKNLQIDLDNITPQYVGKNKNVAEFAVNINSGLSLFLQNSKANYNEQLKYGINRSSILLKDVVIQGQKEQPVKISSNLNGPGNADQVITTKDLITQGCANIADCLTGRLLGVTFRNDTPYLISSMHKPMQIVLDGIFVNTDVLANINTADIGSVEVLRTISYTSIYGGRGGNGLIIITSKTGNDDIGYTRYAPGIITYTPKGYSKVRTYYSPQYDDPKINTKIADLRSTIYWKPNIITDKDGNASFEYFNADTKRTCRVVIEGIDDNGNLGRQVFRYKVE